VDHHSAGLTNFRDRERVMDNIRLILMDWGDTVMVDIPHYSGSMANWPRLEAVPGVKLALNELSGRYLLALASNAEESRGEDALAALDRIGVRDTVQHAFTARDLGIGKDDLGFYLRILQDLDVLPEQAVMVGDGYQGDVLTPSQAGLKTVWYNPLGKPCPRTHPQHDAEISSMDELPGVIEQPGLPTLSDCLDWLRQESAQENLIHHCLAVAACAYWTAAWLKQSGIEVDPLVAHRGGLLHDLDKISGRESGYPHGVWSSELLKRKGYPQIARIAERHVISRILESDRAPETWEEKLVFYADKLVEGSDFVGLHARLQALEGRYPQYAGQIHAGLSLIQAMEDLVLENTGFTRGEFYKRLGSLDIKQYEERI
jgi:putative nucleotidyltransferase with HDIG domain